MDAVPEGDIERIVAESFHAADDIVVIVTHRFHADADRHAVAVFVLHEDMRLARGGILHRRRQRTAVEAELTARIVDVHQDIIRTAAPDYFPAGIA